MNLKEIVMSNQAEQILRLSISQSLDSERLSSKNYRAKVMSTGSNVIVKNVRGETIRALSITNSFLSEGKVVEVTKQGSQIAFVDSRVR